MSNVLLPAALRLDATLHRFVNAEGRVDYASLAAEGSARACAHDFETCDVHALQTRDEKLAFWINAYNCLVIVGVLEQLKRKPTYRGVMDSGVLGALRFFYLRRYVVGGRKLSLATIENRILRGELKEPRIHFALVCASGSCPPLKNGLYSAAHIDRELDDAAQLFIRSPRGIIVERETHTLWLSTIFKWYRKDFERAVRSRAAGSVLNYVAGYLTADDRAYLDRHGPQVKIRYLRYDWSLNSLQQTT